MFCKVVHFLKLSSMSTKYKSDDIWSAVVKAGLRGFHGGQMMLVPESSSSTHFLFSDAPSDLSSPLQVVSLLLFCFASQHLTGLAPIGPYKGTIQMWNYLLVFLTVLHITAFSCYMNNKPLQESTAMLWACTLLCFELNANIRLTLSSLDTPNNAFTLIFSYFVHSSPITLTLWKKMYTCG